MTDLSSTAANGALRSTGLTGDPPIADITARPAPKPEGGDGPAGSFYLTARL